MPLPTGPTPANGEPHRVPRGAAPTDQEVWFGENLRREREARGISQTGLAKQMSAQGFPFHQTTISRIEAGERPVRLAEATTLAELVGAGVGYLTRPPGAAAAMEDLARGTTHVYLPLADIEEATRLAVTNKKWLEGAIERARRAGVEKSVIENAEAALEQEPEDALSRGRERAEDVDKLGEYRGRLYGARSEGPEARPSGFPALAHMRPTVYSEVSSMVPLVRDGKIVVLNVVGMFTQEGVRTVDFAAGLAAGTGKAIERVKDRVFLIRPHSVSLEDVVNTYGPNLGDD